ncbi:response regulator transcription factor [Rathayibacter toxicus]|uniref:DNA-binding response regulator n=1 Tax=Rathayibacter toxicus TaxID=145458 RepID=A0A0C5BSR8_9MICO|nr:response regulator transcription factor [Rathayibacter toxicus]AJM77742.1 MerR family transcriptional regulator [Rathayibacter toxicus]ALS58091.1 two-component system response regulator [Rathayibacter toxicus]KKM45301.1 MerR family transcriptional regulator [Rathayibacter toxicus]PPG21877.1 DNA-binding response regulator [Rathayibacter toxicus]PPG46839.1 DNA-binding response regulator [Rathayibacter toxicus]
MSALRILLAEDIDLVAEAFQVLLEIEPDFEIVARVNRGDLVVAAALRHRPDVALLDVDMPGRNGIEATADLRAANVSCGILLLTALPGYGHVPRALSAGANGYLVKSTTGAQLARAIRTIASGGTAIDSQLAAQALRAGANPLTEREVELLRLVESGARTTAIAAAMHLTPGTVRNYLSNAITKLHATTRAEAVAAGRTAGWL